MARPRLVKDLMIADDVMRLSRIRHLPVVEDDSDDLAGILSSRDLLQGALSRAVGYGERARQRLMGTLVVKEVMTTDPVTIAPDASLREAARVMLDRKIGCLPVVEDGRLVGLLTESDMLAFVARDEDAG